MRPVGAGRSCLLLNIGPPYVAARLSIGEIGDIVEVGDVGDIGSATIVANIGELGTGYREVCYTYSKEVQQCRHGQLAGGC